MSQPPSFLSRPNKQPHSILFTFRGAILSICDPTGPCQSPKATKTNIKMKNLKFFFR